MHDGFASLKFRLATDHRIVPRCASAVCLSASMLVLVLTAA